VFLTFLVELGILAVLVAALWSFLHRLRERGSASPSLKRVLELPDPRSRLIDRKIASEAWDQRALALLVCIATTAALVMLLAATGDETQVFFAVFIGAWVGAIAAHAVVPTRPAPWFWAGPIVTGAVGYLLAWTSTTPADLATGEVGGLFAPLARPLPIDWLAAGVPGALLGYVRSRTKQFKKVAEGQI
jgi:hypothetical protein